MDALDAIMNDMDRERGNKGNEERDAGSFKIPKRSADPRADVEMGSAKRDRSNAARPAEYRGASSSRHHQDEPMDTSPPRAYAASRSTAGARTNIASGRAIEINKTSYQIKLGSAALIQKYQVEVMYTVRARGKDGSPVLKEKNAAIGPHNPVARQQRRIRLFEIISVVLNNEPEFGGMEHRKDHIYDCGNCVMSLSCGLRAEHGKKIFAVNQANLSKETIESLGGEKLECIEVSFEWTRQISPKELNEESNANEVKQFLEILTSQELIETGGYLQYGNSFFERSSSRDMPLSASSGGGRGGRGGRGGGRGGYGGGYGDRSGSRDSRGGYGGDRDRSSSRDGRGGGGEDTNKVLKCGFEKSIGFTAGMVPVLNIDARKSPFSKPMPLLDFLKKEIGARESREVEDGVRDRRKKKEMLNMLRGLVVKTTHMPVPHYIVCSDIVKDSARKMTFEYKGEETSVEKYFELQYQIKLRYPHLPLIVEKKVTGKSYHPIEVLVVAEGQKIRTDQISADVQDAMIGMARASPDQVLRETQQQMEQANLNTGRNSWLQHFGVSVSRDRVQAKGEVLCPPTIEFARQKCEPRNGELRFSAGEFVKGAKLTKMVVVIFDRCMRIDDASRFLGSLADSARSKGMSIDARSARMIEAASEDPERLRCYFKEWMQEGVQMMIGITQQKKDPVHDTLKDFERMGLVTQHLCKQTVDKIANRQGGAQTIDNVLMKINCKGGGTNYHIQPSREWLDRSGNIKDYEWFGADYMYIGVDVSHPGVQHAFDRARGEAVDPTVVGMVYTKGRATEMVGTYWLQQARVNIFQMEGQVLNALLNYFDVNKTLPKHIVVFRGGLSEGETAPVSASEAGELEEAIKRAVDSTRSPHKPTLTIVCAMVHNGHKITRSERDMPRGGKPMEMNLPPGTCIDSGITDPRFKEFYLVSQRGLMGTSSCTIYRVTKEDALAPHDLKKIETITNSLSAGHGVFTGTVSRPAPLYNASKLAERARDTMNHQSMSDDMSVMSGASGSSSRFRGEGAEFFERASEELATQLAGKLHFWA